MRRAQSSDESVRSAVQTHAELIKTETLASTLEVATAAAGETVTVGDGQLIAVAVARSAG